MKKKFLAALLFFCIFSSGCSITDVISTNSIQTNQNTVDKQNSTNAEPTTPDSKDEPSPAEFDETEDPAPDDAEKNSDGKPAENSPAEFEETKDPTPDDVTKTSNGKPAETPPENNGEPSPPPEPVVPEEKVEPKIGGFFEDLLKNEDPMLLGIIAALICLSIVLIWLIYDRRKIRTTLNNLNNSPPNSNATPQSSSPVTPANESMTLRVDNLQQIGSRKEQQDSFCLSNIGDKKSLSEKGLMAVVADGMGGMEGGAAVSRLVTETFLDSYNNQTSFEPGDFLYRTAESSEFAVENYMNQTGINGGSTLVAVIIKNSQLHYVSVGDSHIYLLRDNTLTLLNKEHNLGALLKEKAERGEVDPMEPYTNPKRNSLTAYIGMGSFQIVDRSTNPIILQGGDKVVLCSDGVYNALGDDALINALAGTASTAAKKIQEDILAQNIPSQDNFTAIIIECVDS